MRVIFVDDLFFIFPPEIGNKVTVVKLNHHESLYWCKQIKCDLDEIEEIEPGDIIINRVFDENEVADWYLFRILHF